MERNVFWLVKHINVFQLIKSTPCDEKKGVKECQNARENGMFTDLTNEEKKFNRIPVLSFKIINCHLFIRPREKTYK